MSTDEFKDNKTEILKIQTSSDFAKYVELYGEERAQGYLDAMLHVLKDTDDMFTQRYAPMRERVARPPYVRTKLKNYLLDKTELMNNLNIKFVPRNV
ncbi:hypothetical protein D3C87_297770 [compost metagenome]